jgi:hypothetical protein
MASSIEYAHSHYAEELFSKKRVKVGHTRFLSAVPDTRKPTPIQSLCDLGSISSFYFQFFFFFYNFSPPSASCVLRLVELCNFTRVSIAALISLAFQLVSESSSGMLRPVPKHAHTKGAKATAEWHA